MLWKGENEVLSITREKIQVPHKSLPLRNETGFTQMAPNLEVMLDGMHKLSLDPQPDWDVEDLLGELKSIETKDGFPLHEDKSNQSEHILVGRGFNCNDLSAVANFGRSSKPFVMRVFDDDSDDMDEETDLENKDEDVSRITNNSTSPSVSSSKREENDQIKPVSTQRKLIASNDIIESSLFELERDRVHKVQEEIRERMMLAQQHLETETERSASALLLVENNEAMKREMALRLDKQYQRKIAEARDNHLSAVQRDHQQRTQIEERRIKKEAAIVEAMKRDKEAREFQERQEKARELQARQEKAREESKKIEMEKMKAIEEERKRAIAESERKKAAEAAKKASEEAEKKALQKAEKIKAETEKNIQEDVRVRVAPNAAKSEAERMDKLSKLEFELQRLVSNGALSQELKSSQRKISKCLHQISGTMDHVRATSRELITVMTNPHFHQHVLATQLAAKAIYQCEAQTISLDNMAFALAHVIVLVTVQVPIALDLVLAQLHKACIFTVPKYILFSKGAFKTKELYLREALGYKESDGTLESAIDFVSRMRSYVTLYAAITQVEIRGVDNPHGIKFAWAWIARFLKTIPPNKTTAEALMAFIRIAGFRLYQTYPKPFTKLLKVIETDFLPRLKSQNDPEGGAAINKLETYLTDHLFKKEPAGLRLPESDVSKIIRC